MSAEWADVAKELTAGQSARIRRAAEAVERAERDLATAREAFRAVLEEVHNEGAPLVAIGRELDVTRQRVAQIIRG